MRTKEREREREKDDGCLCCALCLHSYETFVGRRGFDNNNGQEKDRERERECIWKIAQLGIFLYGSSIIIRILPMLFSFATLKQNRRGRCTSRKGGECRSH